MTVPILENKTAKLTLLDLRNYKYLIDIAQQENLVQYSPSDISTPEKLKDYVKQALDGYYLKTVIPFIVYDKRSKLYAGSTRYMNISSKNKTLEIGSTWIGKAFQGTGLNINMKFLMLQYAFETMNFSKVEFRIDERNLRSRKAAEKIGATFEGLLRKNIIMLDGFKRSTSCYGILEEEWAGIKNSVFEGLLDNTFLFY